MLKRMVLESLFNPFVLKKKPWQMLVAGFLYSIIGLTISYLVFKEIAGILTVFLIVLAVLPTFYITIKKEEELDLRNIKEWILLKEHTKVIIYLIFLFFGITLALVFAYITLPEPVVDTIFELQRTAILNVNNNIRASLTGQITKIDLFGRIFFNNLKVLFFCLLFSLLYGTGAMFILTWNASVIATAIGNLVKSELAHSASLIGLNSVAAYFGVITFGFLRYMAHGILEIAAYFIAGLAGGIISIALIKHNLKENKILIDTLYLILISLGLLVLGSFIEVYITPLFFA